MRHPQDDFCPFRVNYIDGWRQRLHRKRFTWHSVNQESDAGGVFGEAGEGFGGNLAGVFTELFGEVFCVVTTDLEGDDRADIAEDGVDLPEFPDVFHKLRAGGDLGKRSGRER